MRCKACHYLLANLTEHRCPECGSAFDPCDPSTFETERSLIKLYAFHFIPLAMLTVMAAWAILHFIPSIGRGVWDVAASSLLLFPVILSTYGIIRWHVRRRAFKDE